MRRLAIGLLAAAMVTACDAGTPGEIDGGNPVDDGGIVTDTGIDPPDGGPVCVDEDSDGYGEGCDLGPDCDDTSGEISPAATETCNGVDDDCDDATDEDVGTPSCALTEGVCAGATARCGASGFLECDGTDYGTDYEADETACDGLDNDCDGSTDEGCTCTDGETQPCGSDVGVCSEGTQTCADAAWGACEGEVAPMGEVCDGADNDCDGTDDEAADLTPPDCPLQLGVCSGSKRACGGSAGWIACSGTASYGGDYQADETLCDTMDNDCDGVTDEGCECVDGATQACGTDVGACMAGTQTCVAGAWGGCAGETAAVDETCDGTDEDCDGAMDEDVVAPACALTDGVCAGASQACTGSGGFVACTATEYGTHYEATETSCDGRDNDCDGTVDEGCTCVDGTTQPCGVGTGACTRGTQTCSAGEWGTCTGGTGPTAESCNGLDDDCNGTSDDGLTPPPCSLATGVCTGATQTCDGASGWTACSGTASYGPRYVATEDGASDEMLCDGLDNDCNGTVDDGCVSGPLVSRTEDVIVPDIYNRHLAYSINLDGNWDVMFENLDRGTARRLTTTTEDELDVRISGDVVVYVRGTGAAARAVMYELATDTETVLATGQTGNVDIAGSFIVWDEVDGAQWDVIVYDMTDGSTTTLGSSTTDEFGPAVRGGRVAYVGTSTGTPLVHVVENTAGTWGAPTVQTSTATGGAGHQGPYLDFVSIAWTDGRNVTGTPAITSDWDAYVAPFSAVTGMTAWPGENVLANGSGAQITRDVDSQIALYDDMAAGDWNVAAGFLGATPVTVTSSTATQAAARISGSHLVWHDNRLGTFAIYESFYVGATFAPAAGDLVIAEVLADPASGADPNGDGTASTTQDEFVEIVNVTAVALDLSGLTLSDASGVRHTFPAGTFLPSYGIAVVFGGGTPTGTFAGAVVQPASSGTLGFNNTGDTLTLENGATVIDTATYGSEGGDDQSIVRDGAGWQQHSTDLSAGPYSVGTYPDGFVP